ncbi:matrixin family metalloprotease [Flavobacterium sediminilitoris]|uniref:Matrixin family metalloprotease n=2 Tax=Flavobacterium TaxID=237 RepID=A0ABY4HKP7_9FLAO|nr:matrixin family metalloprotease [Flavobacterium sediminilitoris]UOX33416.1 matrixin family metalloprotease [Flavobacterium sediminilitoris]
MVIRFFFCSIIIMLCSCTRGLNKNTIVGIQPYAGFSKGKADTIAITISEFYKVKTIVLPEIKLPKEAFIQIKSARYRADSIIKIQNKAKADTLDFIIGITQSDISTTKKDKSGKTREPKYKYEDWGIMGLAYCPGNSCIVSTFRLQHKNSMIHFTRLKKVAVHEFGHNLGLPHCSNKKCVMTDAVESIKTIDNTKLTLCEVCFNRI